MRWTCGLNVGLVSLMLGLSSREAFELVVQEATQGSA